MYYFYAYHCTSYENNSKPESFHYTKKHTIYYVTIYKTIQQPGSSYILVYIHILYTGTTHIVPTYNYIIRCSLLIDVVYYTTEMLTIIVNRYLQATAKIQTHVFAKVFLNEQCLSVEHLNYTNSNGLTIMSSQELDPAKIFNRIRAFYHRKRYCV